MPLDTYQGLKDEIIDELDRSDLVDKVDMFIDLAEARHRTEVRIREMIKRSRADFSERYVSLPSGFLQMKTLRLVDPMLRLEEVTEDELTRRHCKEKGRPRYFTIHEEIEFDREPSEVITAEMIYWAVLTPLSDSNTTNALLERGPALYFYGALQESAPWVTEDERLQTWSALYSQARDSLMLSDRLSRYGGPIATQVAGATP